MSDGEKQRRPESEGPRPRWKNVRLGFDDLRQGFLKDAFQGNAHYFFTFDDLQLAREDPPSSELENDLVEIGDKDKETAEVEVACPCVTIVIIARSPTDNGAGRNNARWGQGQWGKPKDGDNPEWNKDAFQKLIGDALALCGFPTYCINVFEVDLSAAKYAKYFAKDDNGKLTDALAYDEVEHLVSIIRQLIAPNGTDRCFTLCFARAIMKKSPDKGMITIWQGGTTPFEPEDLPKGTPPSPFAPKIWSFPFTWKLKSKNFSFYPDSASSGVIAHEIFHQGGCTHAKDNLLYPGESPEADPTAIPAEAERTADDLMNPKLKAGAKPTPADLKKLSDYVAGNKCCDIKDSSGKAVKKVRPA